VSPYAQNRAVVQYVNPARTQALVLAYNLHLRFNEEFTRVRLEGLDPARNYKVQEINLMPGAKSEVPENGQTYSGDYLMKVGALVSGNGPKALTSHVLEVAAQ
jgi:alpha-galactosidase